MMQQQGWFLPTVPHAALNAAYRRNTSALTRAELWWCWGQQASANWNPTSIHTGNIHTLTWMWLQGPCVPLQSTYCHWFTNHEAEIVSLPVPAKTRTQSSLQAQTHQQVSPLETEAAKLWRKTEFKAFFVECVVPPAAWSLAAAGRNNPGWLLCWDNLLD